MRLVLSGTLLASAMVAGCSIYPAPENVSHADTYEIVRNVRCETREAIRSYALGKIEKYDTRVYNGLTGPELVEHVHAGLINFNDIAIRRLPSPIVDTFAYYADTRISYDFTLDITETNNAGFSTSILQTLTGRTNTIGITASNNLIREVRRNFRVFDTFQGLAFASDKYCFPHQRMVNFEYPVTGIIDAKNFIGAFLDLNQSGNLTGGKDQPTIPALSDTILFTTKLVGNIDPVFTMHAIADSFSLASAAITFDNSRQDLHQVLISISLPPARAGLASTGGAASRNANADVILNQQKYNGLLLSIDKLGNALTQP